MIRNEKSYLSIFVLCAVIPCLLCACSNLPLIGEKKQPANVPTGKTVTVEEMEQLKGVNPPKSDAQAPSKKPSVPAVATPLPKAADKETKIASAAPLKPFGSPLPFLQEAGYRKKIVVLDFENKTTYKDESIGEEAARKFSDKLDATRKTVLIDGSRVSEILHKEGIAFQTLSDPPAMKQAHQSTGIQAFVTGTVEDLSLLTSKKSETSDEEVSFATSKIEIRLIDASTGNLLKTFIGRSPIFGTRETGDNSRGKAVGKAIDSCIDEIMEGFLKYLDLLEWSTSIARTDGDNLYINAGKLSGLRVGDTLEIFGPGKEITQPTTGVSLGWTTGTQKGAVRLNDLFGVDAAVAKIVQGQGFMENDIVKSTVK